MFNLNTNYLNCGYDIVIRADNDTIEELLYWALDEQREMGYATFKEWVLGRLEEIRCELEDDFVADYETLLTTIILKCVAFNDNLPIANEALDWESSFANESVAA